MGKKKVSLIQTAHAIESLRESDFDTYSALGEVIDNSLQAEASQIHVGVKKVDKPKSKGPGRSPKYSYIITELAVGDDGCGMDSGTLHQCLQLGFSTRYNDRSGIGRFGVGMTLAAISQCRRIEVYSKEKKGPAWLHTYVDLDELGKTSYISEPVKKSPPSGYKSLLGKSHGTLVIWKKCDRVNGSTEELTHWVARTYRKFIGSKIVRDGKLVKRNKPAAIAIDGKPVEMFDPLFCVPPSSAAKEPTAVLFEEMHLDMPVPVDMKGKGSKTSKVTIQMSITPKEWRKRSQTERTELAQSLGIDENEGFSVLRSGREVFYDVMPHFKPAVHGDGHDRWWSAEISFEPVLDRYFSVKNVKRGARFVRDLREKIQEKMRATIMESRKVIKQDFDKVKQEHILEGHDVTTGHSEAENLVKGVNPPAGRAGSDKSKDDKKKEIEEIIGPLVKSEEEMAAWRAKIESQPCTIVDNEGNAWKGETFLDIHPQGGNIIIEYNMAHRFFMFVYGLAQELSDARKSKKSEQVVEIAQKLKGAIDLLFMAYAQAESQFDPEQSQPVEETLSFLRSNWGAFLRRFVTAYEKEH